MSANDEDTEEVHVASLQHGPIPRNLAPQRQLHLSAAAILECFELLSRVFVTSSHRLRVFLSSLHIYPNQGINTGAGMVVFDSPVTVATVLPDSDAPNEISEKV